MKTTTINVKVEPKVKRAARKAAEELGLSLSAVINGYLKQFARTKEVHFSAEPELSEWARAELEASRQDVADGFVSPAFDSIEEELQWLKDPKAKYANGRSVHE